jgi:hypothetical protein
MTRGRTIAALGVIAVLATACFRADVDLTLTSDSTINGTVLLAYERAGLEELDRSPNDAQGELLADLEVDAPEGMTCEAWDDEGYIGARCELQRVTFDAFSLTDTFQQEIVIVREGDRIRLFAVINLGDVPVGDQELIDAFDVRIRVKFPGRVISQQNGMLDGQTVTWSLPPGEQTAIEAVAEAGAGQADGFPMGPAIGALLAVTLAALVLAVRRQSGTPG